MIRRVLILFFLLLLAVGVQAYTVKEIPNVHLTDSRRYTSDPDNILSPRAHAVIDSLAADLRSRTSSELAVVIVNSIDDAEPEQFATALFNDWRIGKQESNNGVLVLVVMDENYCIIRTGYGAEGVLPDITAGRIRREIMNPYFRDGLTDSAMTEGIRAIHSVITKPDAAAELLANYETKRQQREAAADKMELLSLLALSAVFGGAMAFLLIFLYYRKRRKYGVTALPKLYQSTLNLRAAALGTSFFGLGIPLLAYLFLRGRLKNLRDTPPACSGCSTPMQRLDKPQGFGYLTPVQQTEQRLGSADYDVWRCPSDGSVVTREFPGINSSYTRCPNCGARARHLVSDRVIVPSTTYRQGQGQRHYHCEHCGNDDYTTYHIPRKAPIVVVGGGGGRGFGGGGGFSGGSFGGGFSGGGGSGGRW
ncbi:MAG: TPM domain-containing protein [Muribaculaceae bacterium]|nr:TPM domain-containing protein [Muribaculaceae bacterium]